MTPIAVTMAALREAANREVGAEGELHHLQLDRVERALWSNKLKPGEAFSVSWLRKTVDVEFGLWGLQHAQEGLGADDRSRLVAAWLAWHAVEWLEAEVRTEYALTARHVQDLMTEVRGGTFSTARWLEWAEILDGLMRAQTSGSYGANALFAACWCGQGMVVPAPYKEAPTARAAIRLGRRCAYAAYDNLRHAWVTQHEAFRAAHEIADLATDGDPDAHPLIGARLRQVNDALYERADAALQAIVEVAWSRFVELTW